MHGWIRFPRKQFVEKWFSQKPYCRGYAWTCLCAMAAHTLTRAGKGADIIEVARGQMLTSIKSLASKFGWSRARVTRFICALKAGHLIDTRRVSQFTLITINNYDDYHGFENRGHFGTSQGADTPRTGNGQDSHTYKNKKENYKKHFAPDSCEIRLAKCLLAEIRKGDPGFREPDLPSWAGHIGLLLRADCKTPEEILRVIGWSQRDPFWRTVIRSARKLRMYFDRMAAKSKPKGALDDACELYELRN